MIIPRHEYERLKNDLHLAQLVIKLKNGKIDSQQEIIKRLISENEALRNIVSINHNIDFPNSKKNCEDKII